ncbi:MAG: NotI family restriction endonuclease [Anaerolineae bacterium]|nr:NotI family restriction endonuclease [Anaerolineae bacterium]
MDLPNRGAIEYDASGKSVGNLDTVLIAFDEEGGITDSGALEIQAVYISGNVRRPFERYMEDPEVWVATGWAESRDYPRPDYLSSSRKRLIPQLLFKGGILRSWNKKIAVALGKTFYDALPPMAQVDKQDAEIAWLVYDLELTSGRYRLTKVYEAFTKFDSAMLTMITPSPSRIEEFVTQLRKRLNGRLEV